MGSQQPRERGLRRSEWSTVPANEKPSKQRPEVSVRLVGLQGERPVGSTGAEAGPVGVMVYHSTSTPVPTPSGLSDDP